MIGIFSALSVVTGVAACVVTELQNTPESGGVPANMRVCVVPGEIAWDSCQCGQLAFSIVRWFPSIRFPTESTLDVNTGPCDPYARAVEVTASIIRCVTGMDNSGNPPECSALLADTMIQQADAFALERGVGCCLDDMQRVQRIITAFRISGPTFIGPSGNCGGSQLTFYFQLM